ncbi:MAG: RlmE family RNA methyltransferase [Thermodesulfobacteriota bacterium]|nr:RlmE family RNA methyltransferase [Thermodesulfobacteriota bacterium]
MNKNRWDDHYARRAREGKWLARSVYKIQEIDNKFRLIRRGSRLLDLGCYPGSWSQYGIKKTGYRGEVVGIDFAWPKRLSSPNFRFIQSDVLTLETEWLIREVGLMDLVMSDLAPQTTGTRLTDTSRSMALATRAAEIALSLLKKRGHFVCKVFEGGDIRSFRSEVSAHFRQTRLYRPKATRRGSIEVYLIGLELVKATTQDNL